MKNFWKFLKVLGVNIGLAILLIILLVFVTLWGIKKYTHHGEAISVPNFFGLTVEEVGVKCNESLLRFEIIDSVYSDKAERGAVVDQSPKENFKVKENRTIFLTINALFPERVKMPKVTGVSLRQATALLETYGLKVGRLDYVHDWATNAVKQQKYKGKEIPVDALIEKWSEIDLVVGKQSNVKGIVPNVLGHTLEEAERMLTEVGFNIGIISVEANITTREDSLKAVVWKQNPTHSQKVEVSLGNAVDLSLTLDPSIAPGSSIPDNDTVNK